LYEKYTPVRTGCSCGEIVHSLDRCKYLKNWLAALDDFRNWLIREAA